MFGNMRLCSTPLSLHGELSAGVGGSQLCRLAGLHICHDRGNRTLGQNILGCISGCFCPRLLCGVCYMYTQWVGSSALLLWRDLQRGSKT